MFPDGITTRVIEVGPASDLSSGAPLSIRVMLESSRQLVWEGTPVLTSLKTYNFAPGAVGEIELPVTDQDGYRDSKGNPIILGVGEHSTQYILSVFYMRNGSVVQAKPKIRVVLPEGNGSPVDIDEMVSVGTVGPGNTTIALPDAWTQLVSDATRAAEDAAASAAESEAAAQAAETAIEELEGNIGTSVEEWFETNAGVVVSPTVLEEAIEAHKEEPTPHKAYDIDLPSLTVLFENGLA